MSCPLPCASLHDYHSIIKPFIILWTLKSLSTSAKTMWPNPMGVTQGDSMDTHPR